MGLSTSLLCIIQSFLPSYSIALVRETCSGFGFVQAQTVKLYDIAEVREELWQHTLLRGPFHHFSLVDHACGMGSIKLARWAWKNGIPITKYACNRAVMHCHPHAVVWARRHEKEQRIYVTLLLNQDAYKV